MREILFRGKRVDNEEWVYGSLLIDCDNSRMIIPSRKGVFAGEKVITESVGQFTGLLDKNENKIFKGDKVKAFGSVYDVVFNDGAFYLRKENIHHRLSRTIQDLEIIGNIHEDGNK